MARTIRTTDKKTEPTAAPRKRAPAKTIEGRENQLISMAFDLAETQLADGSASSQTMSHFLKSGSTKDRLEKKRLEREIELLNAKVEALKSTKNSEELYANALDAMRKYSGNEVEEDYEH